MVTSFDNCLCHFDGRMVSMGVWEIANEELGSLVRVQSDAQDGSHL